MCPINRPKQQTRKEAVRETLYRPVYVMYVHYFKYSDPSAYMVRLVVLVAVNDNQCHYVIPQWASGQQSYTTLLLEIRPSPIWLGGAVTFALLLCQPDCRNNLDINSMQRFRFTKLQLLHGHDGLDCKHFLSFFRVKIQWTWFAQIKLQCTVCSVTCQK